MLQVVVAREVIDDRQAFHDCVSTIVMIDNDWDAAIRVELDKPRLLLDVLEDVDTLTRVLLTVCFFQLLEQDRNFVACADGELNGNSKCTKSVIDHWMCQT